MNLMFSFRQRNKRKIGFVVDKQDSYYKAMASTRLRCYDVMQQLNKEGYTTEIYQVDQPYDVVIFQKCFSEEHLGLAKDLKEKGIVTVLDININIVEEYGEVTAIFSSSQLASIKRQRSDIHEFLKEIDHVLVSSFALVESYRKYHSSVFCIEEMVTSNFFKQEKKHQQSSAVTLLYSGYAVKAKELEGIREVLTQLHMQHKIEVLCLSERVPEIDMGQVPVRFISYEQKRLPALLLEGDIKVAPRNLANKYNIGHSFTKVAYPMAVGIPAVASPVPSYLNREVLTCEGDESWYHTLSKLILHEKLRGYYGKRGRAFVLNNFSAERIGKQYIDFIDLIAEK